MSPAPGRRPLGGAGLVVPVVLLAAALPAAAVVGVLGGRSCRRGRARRQLGGGVRVDARRFERPRRAPTPASSAWRPHPAAAVTGWSPRTAASSASATPGSRARPAACGSTRRWSAWRPPPTGAGYWLVAARRRGLQLRRRRVLGLDGQPEAQRAGRRHGRRPPTARGYWLVAADGGVFSFGDAGFWGSAGATPLNAPSWAWRPRPTGTATGWSPPTAGSSRYGDAGFWGSAGATRLNAPVAGDGGRTRRWRLLAGGERRGRLHLRVGRRSTGRSAGPGSPRRWWAWRRRRRGRATGWRSAARPPSSARSSASTRATTGTTGPRRRSSTSRCGTAPATSPATRRGPRPRPATPRRNSTSTWRPTCRRTWSRRARPWS